jgi:hypothetical protein
VNRRFDMAYPQDLVGKFIGYRLDQGIVFPPEVLANRVVDNVLKGMVTQARAPVYKFIPGHPGSTGGAPPIPARWIDTKKDWSFTFLQYVAGAVTVAPLLKPVLTGPMSGCFLFKYSDPGPNVAHVGTANAADSVATKLAKASWQGVTSRRPPPVAAGASPYAVFQFDEITAAVLGPGCIPMVAGYFDPTHGQAYSMLLSPVPRTMSPPVTPMLKVSALRTMSLLSWQTIRNLPQWLGSVNRE